MYSHTQSPLSPRILCIKKWHIKYIYLHCQEVLWIVFIHLNWEIKYMFYLCVSLSVRHTHKDMCGVCTGVICTCKWTCICTFGGWHLLLFHNLYFLDSLSAKQKLTGWLDWRSSKPLASNSLCVIVLGLKAQGTQLLLWVLRTHTHGLMLVQQQNHILSISLPSD